MRLPDPRYSLVIFDLDGTLVDSFPWFLRVVNDVAREFGFKPLAAEDIPVMRGAGARDILKHLDVPLWKVPRIASHMRRLKRAQIAEFRLFPGVSEMLASLRNQGIRLALVSSDSEANARSQLGPSASCFSDFDCGASLFGKSAKFRGVARRAGVEPSKVIAIGDETRDLDAAHEAGIAFGGVSWGYADPEALRARKPALWFDSVADITHTLMRAENAASEGLFDLHARE
jgi:phosphoglycolate phosphatase